MLRPTAERSKQPHLPVLLEEVLELFRELALRHETGTFCDVTLGAAGHTSALLEAHPGWRVLGLDQDPDALAIAQEKLDAFGDRSSLCGARMSELSDSIRKGLDEQPIGVLMDLGVSSMQLDRPERGFSFGVDGPLDMRMDPTRTRTAADIVNSWDESDLADLFFYEGDETRARRIAKGIVQARRRAPFMRTAPLADLIAQAKGGGGGRTHPATQTFQALRRAVNEEGEELNRGLQSAEEELVDGGLLAVISFHSGEDRVVKKFLAQGAREGRWKLITKKPISASHHESRTNRRARSAHLRAAWRTRSAEEGNA